MGNVPLGRNPFLLVSEDVVLGRCMYTLDASGVDVVEVVDSTCESKLPKVDHNRVSSDDAILGGCMYTLVKSDVVVVKSIEFGGAVEDDEGIVNEELVSGYEPSRERRWTNIHQSPYHSISIASSLAGSQGCSWLFNLSASDENASVRHRNRRRNDMKACPFGMVVF